MSASGSHTITQAGTIACSCGETFFTRSRAGFRATSQSLARANAERHASAANAREAAAPKRRRPVAKPVCICDSDQGFCNCAASVL